MSNTQEQFSVGSKTPVTFVQAAQIAMEALQELYPAVNVQEDVLLEEILQAEENNRIFWHITYSIPRIVKNNNTSAVAALMGPRIEKEYKTIVVDAETGIVKSMLIRKI